MEEKKRRNISKFTHVEYILPLFVRHVLTVKENSLTRIQHNFLRHGKNSIKQFCLLELYAK